MLVKNISQDLQSLQSKKNWFSYWKYYKLNKSIECSVPGCRQNSSLGALVEKSSIHYVVGFCECHGLDIHKSGIVNLELGKNAELVKSSFTM